MRFLESGQRSVAALSGNMAIFHLFLARIWIRVRDGGVVAPRSVSITIAVLNGVFVLRALVMGLRYVVWVFQQCLL